MSKVIEYKGYTLHQELTGVAIKSGGLTITIMCGKHPWGDAQRWVDARVPDREEYRGYILESGPLTGGVAILELSEVQRVADMNMAYQWVDARVGEVNPIPLDADTYYPTPTSHPEQEPVPVRDKLDTAYKDIEPCQIEPERGHWTDD